MRPLRWGILSTAHIASHRMLPAFARSATNTVVAVASRDPARAQAFAARFGIPRAHGAYDALLTDPDVEAIYNPLPNGLHREWTIRAAASGKHVLCEKPLGVDAADAQAIVEACAREGVVLQEAFMYRFHPQFARLRVLLQDGVGGRPWLVRAWFTFTVTSATNIRLNATLGGGGLLDVGCYAVNISRMILGEPSRAFAAADFDAGVDVRLAGALQFPSGVALLDCGVRAPYRQGCEVVGTEGTIALARPFQPEEDPAVLVVRRQGQEERVEIPPANQYQLMLDHFAAVIRGDEPPRYAPSDAIANMRALDMLARSARSGTAADVET